MNERIRQLAEQAAKKHGHTIKFSPEITETLDSFAELIVKECANVIADAVDHREPASTYVGKIKQHFGVES